MLFRSKKAEVIGDMFTLPLKGLIYAHDKVKTLTGYRNEDQWDTLASFPELHNACYDCEDGMILVTEYFNAFKTAEFTNVNLMDMQAFLTSYRVCCALGQLRGGQTTNSLTQKVMPTYVLHAFVMLIDHRRFGLDASSSLLPSIILETTNYLASTFSEKQIQDSVEGDVYDHGDGSFDILSRSSKQGTECSDDEMHWRYIVHLKAPPNRISSEKIYGLFHSVYSVDPASNAMCHHLFKTTTGHVSEVGADAISFLTDASRSHTSLQETSRVSESFMDTLQCITCENSPLTMPDLPAPMQSLPTLNAASHSRFIIKDIGNSETIKKALDALKQLSFTGSVTTTRIELFAKCFVFVVDVPFRIKISQRER